MRKLLLLLAVAVLGCGGDDVTGPVSVAGTWQLSTVNGAALPFTIASFGGDKVELMSDVITATGSGTFTQVTTFKTTQSGQVTTDSETDAGTFVVNGTAITFTFNSDGSTGTGSLSGNTMTVAESGFSAVYVKQ